MAGQINIKAKLKTGAISEAIVTPKSDPHLVVEFTPGDDRVDIEELSIEDQLGLVEPIKILFKPKCAPDKPFYIRWVNSRGGYDYFMFEAKWAITHTTKSRDTFKAFELTSEGYNYTNKVFNLEPTETIVVGGLVNSEEEQKMLVGVLYSPRVQVYNIVLGTWVDITLDGNQKANTLNELSQEAIELKF